MHQHSILYIISSLETGGAERHLAQVAVELRKKGWSVEIFTFKFAEPLTSYLQSQGISVDGVSLPIWLKPVLYFRPMHTCVMTVLCSLKLLLKFWLKRPYVVHFFLPSAYILGGLISLLFSVPIKIMSRRSISHYQKGKPLFVYIESWLHTRMTRVCGNSMAVINDLKKENVAASRLRLIYNGVDVRFYDKPFDRGMARASLDISEDTLVFVIVANLIPYKGHVDLIEAFSIIKNQLPSPWRLLCLGRDDGIGFTLQQQVQMASMGENIQFLGTRHDVSDFLKMADVGILCSHQEGFSNAILEGMAAGLPMVVTEVGGNAEAVLDGNTGYVVPAKNPQQLAQALLKIAYDKNRVDMGQRGKLRVENFFSMTSCIQHYEKLYQECTITDR